MADLGIAVAVRALLAGWLIGLLGFLGASLSAAAGAQAPAWQRDGLDGREVRALALVPGGGVLALGGSREPSPLWVRDAQGWSQPGGILPGFVLALAALPDGSALLGAGRDLADQPGIFQLSGTPATVRRIYDAQAVGALAVGRGQPAELLAASAPWADRDAGSQLLRRDPTSGAWSTLLEGTLLCGPTPSYFRQIVVSPSDALRLYAVEWCFASVLRQTQLWRSDDHGSSWHTLPRPGATFHGTLAVDPTDANRLYLAPAAHASAPQPGLLRSDDGGSSWVSLGETIEGLVGVRALLIHPDSPERMFAGTERAGVLASDDQGETWAPLPGLEGLRVSALAYDADSNRLYAATADGVWRLAP